MFLIQNSESQKEGMLEGGSFGLIEYRYSYMIAI
jgi:hypothetical protein